MYTSEFNPFDYEHGHVLHAYMYAHWGILEAKGITAVRPTKYPGVYDLIIKNSFCRATLTAGISLTEDDVHLEIDTFRVSDLPKCDVVFSYQPARNVMVMKTATSLLEDMFVTCHRQSIRDAFKTREALSVFLRQTI